MKQFKRLLSVLITITLIFGIIAVPAFAAQSLKYEDEARVLNQLGLFKGVSEKEYKPNLEAKLLREEAVALLLRMFGLEDEALKMSEKDATNILKRFKDVDEIAAWAIKYIAYAVENGVIVGRPDGNFAPKDNLLGREYSKMILAMLGYVQGIDFQYSFSTVEFCNVTGFSQYEAARLDEENILRDDVVGMSFFALTAEYVAGKNKGATVIEAIVGDNEELKEIAINAGLMEEAVIVSVAAISDIEIKVGQLLRLPTTVRATFSDGKVADVPVKWPYIDTSKAMSKTLIYGEIEGTGIVAKAYVTIEDVVLRVNSVTADNLIEVVVDFNKDISKNEEVINKENYSLDVAKVKSVEASGNTAVLTLEKAVANQKKAKLTITEKILPAKETIGFTFFDATLPEIVDLEVTGPKEFTITFTEPIGDADEAKVTVKTGNSTLSVNKGGIEVGKAKVKVPLYSSLADGKEYVVTIQGFKDYAAYNNVIRTITFDYVKDQTPPLAEIESATQEYVVVKFNKPVSGLHRELFSHTFTAWTASKITADEDNTAIDSTKSYDKVYVWFYTGDKKNDRPIPEGNNVLRILGKVTASDDGKTYELKDLWGNKFETETYTVTVKADKATPEVKKINVIAENAIEIEFTKKVSFDNDNLEVLDNAGKTISGLTLDIEPVTEASKFTVTFNKRLAGKTVLVNIKNVYDASLNSNKLDFYSEAIDITDRTPPEITKVTYGVEKDGSKEVAWFLYTFFNENIDSETALNSGNYYLKNGITYTKLTGTTEFYAGDKIVKISLTSKQKDLIRIDSTELFVTNVKDMANNEIMPSLTKITDMTHKDNAPYIKEAVAVEQDKIIVTFSEELGTYDMDAFEVKLSGISKTIEVVGLDEEIDSNGRTKLTMMINGKLPSNTSADKIKIIEPRAITNLFGVMPVVTEKTITDGIKPELISKNPVVVSANGKIVIRFTEALDASTTSNIYIPIDLEIYKKSNPNYKLAAGTEYTAVVDNTHETLWVEGEYIDVYGKVIININSVSTDETYRIRSKDTILYIKDAKGNTAKPFTKPVEIKGSDLIANADSSALASAKKAAGELAALDYTTESWAALSTALALPEDTNAKIVTKTNAINKAITNLVFAGKAALDAEKTNANKKFETDYTAESWKALADALLLPEDTNTKIVTKTNAINTAIANLVFAGKAALDDAKIAVNSKRQTDYTVESWETFVAARTTALALPETTNQEIIDKIAAINNAIANLIFTPEAALDKAITEAADDGTATIKLTGNVTKAEVKINKLVSLDLAGHTLTGNVVIESNATGEIDIKAGTIDGNLTVNTPNATVNNSTIVTGTVTINGVAAGTWNENVNGNTIVVNATAPVGLNIGTGSTVGSLTLSTATTVTLTMGEGAGIADSIVINAPVTLISSQPIQAIIANGVTVIVKSTVDGTPRTITGIGDNQPVTITADTSVVVTKEELLSAIGKDTATITLGRDITLDAPLAINRAVTIDGKGKTLTINSGTDKTGDTTSEGLGIFANGVVVKNITVKGNHGDNLIEIYNNVSNGSLKVTLENVAAIGGRKAGIYVNKDEAGTITVDFKNITTSGNGWDAGIGLAAQKAGSIVIANFTGTHNFAESVAVYHEGTTYPGTYEVNGLTDYVEKTIEKQVKWFHKMTMSFEGPTEVPGWYLTAKAGDLSLPEDTALTAILGSSETPTTLTKGKWYYAAVKTVKNIADDISGLQITISYTGATSAPTGPATGDIFMTKMCDLNSSGEGQPKTWYTNTPIWGNNFTAGGEYDTGLITYVFIKAQNVGDGSVAMQFKQGDKVVSNVLVGKIEVVE